MTSSIFITHCKGFGSVQASLQRKERIGVLRTDKQRLPQDASDPFLRPLFSVIFFSLRRLCLPEAIPMTGEDSDNHLERNTLGSTLKYIELWKRTLYAISLKIRRKLGFVSF